LVPRADVVGDVARHATVLGNLAWVEAERGNLDRSLELQYAAADMQRDVGNDYSLLSTRHNIACTLRQAGRREEAASQMDATMPQLLRLADPEFLIVAAEDYGAVLAELGDLAAAARLLGAADAARERHSTPRHSSQAAAVEQAYAQARAALGDETWHEHYRLGSSIPVDNVLAETRRDRTADSSGG
jgi:hypothetical protein